ncbi:MAG: hypothetical protein ACWA41_06100 [Putridiphycobacter sp.]
MRLLNRAWFFILPWFVFGCHSNHEAIEKYQTLTTQKLIHLTNEQKNNTLEDIADYIGNRKNSAEPAFLKTIDSIGVELDHQNEMIDNKTEFSTEFVTSFLNQSIYKFATYYENKKNWFLDTLNYEKSNLNPKDTSLINQLLNLQNLIEKDSKLNPELTKLVLLQTLNKVYIHQFNKRYFTFCGNTKINLNLKYSDKLFHQNELAVVYPKASVRDDSKLSILLFDENTGNFISENGRPKEFNNPIKFKTSNQKDTHTIKGEVMVKLNGELVPLPFEFHYLVE